nr:MAG TPA: hypothetical protein [Caudoviricetes sp.]
MLCIKERLLAFLVMAVLLKKHLLLQFQTWVSSVRQQKRKKSRKSIFKSTGMQLGLGRNGFLLLYSYLQHLALAI